MISLRNLILKERTDSSDPGCALFSRVCLDYRVTSSPQTGVEQSRTFSRTLLLGGLLKAHIRHQERTAPVESMFGKYSKQHMQDGLWKCGCILIAMFIQSFKSWVC